MDRALVVLEPSESGQQLLREAGKLAAGVGAPLEVLSLLTEEEYESDLKVLDKIASEEGTSYSENSIDEHAAHVGQRLATESLGDLNLDYTVEGRSLEEGSERDLIIETAESEDCDHVFITGAQRSPTGKAIFGDIAQSVILNFDGYTTILTVDEV